MNRRAQRPWHNTKHERPQHNVFENSRLGIHCSETGTERTRRGDTALRDGPVRRPNSGRVDGPCQKSGLSGRPATRERTSAPTAGRSSPELCIHSGDLPGSGTALRGSAGPRRRSARAKRRQSGRAASPMRSERWNPRARHARNGTWRTKAEDIRVRVVADCVARQSDCRVRNISHRYRKPSR